VLTRRWGRARRCQPPLPSNGAQFMSCKPNTIRVNSRMRRRPAALARVERAVVQFSRNGGRGILVPAGYILSAGHCVSWRQEGGMALGNDYLEPVRTADGHDL